MEFWQKIVFNSKNKKMQLVFSSFWSSIPSAEQHAYVSECYSRQKPSSLQLDKQALTAVVKLWNKGKSYYTD